MEIWSQNKIGLFQSQDSNHILNEWSLEVSFSFDHMCLYPKCCSVRKVIKPVEEWCCNNVFFVCAPCVLTFILFGAVRFDSFIRMNIDEMRKMTCPTNPMCNCRLPYIHICVIDKMSPRLSIGCHKNVFCRQPMPNVHYQFANPAYLSRRCLNSMNCECIWMLWNFMNLHALGFSISLSVSLYLERQKSHTIIPNQMLPFSQSLRSNCFELAHIREFIA